MNDELKTLYQVVAGRKENPKDGSYTCYLFEQGMDKILKKVGEECAEVIIASKNGNAAEQKEELCDLLYHLIVLMVESGIPLDAVYDILSVRSRKIGNLKQMKKTDHNT